MARSKAKQIEEKAEELLKPIAKAHGVEIYDVEYQKEGQEYYLRAYIDKEGGVTIDDCENVSREYSEALDKCDFMDDAYILEVSSPGLGRRLTKDRHFEASIGMNVEGTTFKPYDGKKEKWFDGVLQSFDDDTVTIERCDSNGKKKENLVLNRKNISRIQLTIDF